MPKYALTLNGNPGSGTAPTALDELLTQIRQYTEVGTNSDDPDSDKVRSILVQPTSPTGANANDLWVQVNSITGRPLALKAYTGVEWRPVSATNTGDSNSRPGDAAAGETYFDTDINVMLMYTGSEWVTQDGSPGDMKYVYIDSAIYTTFTLGKARAEALNPGWEYASDAEGSVLVATDENGDSDYQTAGNTFGTNEHTLVEGELPTVSATGKAYGNDSSTTQEITVSGLGVTVLHENSAHTTGSSNNYDLFGPVVLDEFGNDEPHENRQPSYTAFLMRKLGY